MQTNPPQAYPGPYAPRRPVWPWVVGGVVVVGAVAGGLWYARQASAAAFAANGNGRANGEGAPESFFGRVETRENMDVGQLIEAELPLGAGMTGNIGDAYWSVEQTTYPYDFLDVTKVYLNGTVRYTFTAKKPGHTDVVFSYNRWDGSVWEVLGKFVQPVTIT